MVRTLNRSSTRFLTVLLLFFLALVFLLAIVILPATAHMTHGFIGYYTAALLLRRGQLGPEAYDNEWFINQVQTIAQQPIGEIMTPSLPTASLIALPFTFLPPQVARATWIWFNLLMLLLGLGLLLITHNRANQKRGQPLWWWVFIAFAFIFPAVAANFRIGQSIILFFGLFALALFGLVKRQERLAGLALGLAFILKTTGLSLWLLLLVQRRWRALAWGIGLIGVIFLISLPWIGLATWAAYFQAAWIVTSGSTVAVTAYQTTAGFFAHLFHFDPTWNPNPIANWPALAQLLTLLTTIASLTITLWWGRSAPEIKFFAALIPLSIVLLPVAEEHHFVILLIPIFSLIDDLYQYPPGSGVFSLDYILLALALCLLIVPIRYDDLALSAGWWALLAYPRLYGAWLVWLVALRRMTTRATNEVHN
ncbi:MAG: DUF2029 domain-containing protein [Chloroflexi bacterium]|nr:DUF2029 domain-containing protein [Chloroflexota bacterium]